MSYDAFISYSHAADGRLAPALQDGLQRFAKRWTARRALRVFRDDTGLSVNTALWPSIQASLDESRFFILLASPEASRSEWVDREVSRWIELGRSDRILPVLTDGEWVWDPDAGDFDWERTTAVPRSLEGAFTQEPRHLDLRWAHSAAAQEKLHLRNGDFRSAIAELAAPIHGRPKDELEGRDLREHRKARRLRRLATTALVVLAVALGVAAVTAVRSAQEARRQEQLATTQAQRATSRQQAAQSVALAGSQLDLSLLLALSSRAVHDSTETRGALLTALETNPSLVTYVRSAEGAVSAIAASSDALFAVGDSTGVVRVLDFDQLSELARVELPDGARVTSLAFSNAENLLAAGTQTGDVAVWAHRRDELTPLAGVDLDGPVRSLAFDAAGDQLAAVWTPSDTDIDSQDSFAVWQLSRPSSPRLASTVAPLGAQTISFADTDTVAVVGAFELERFDVDTGAMVETWPLRTGGAQPGPSAHTPGGEIGAWSTLDRGDMGIYTPGPTVDDTDVATVSVDDGAIDTLTWDHEGAVLGMAKEGRITLWRDDGTQLAEMSGAESGITDLVFAGNSDRMASLGNGVVQIWDPGARSRLAMRAPVEATEVPNVVKRVVDVDMSTDGRQVAWIANPGGSYRSDDERFADGQNVALWEHSSSRLTTFAASSTPCTVGFLDDDVVATGQAGCGDDPSVQVWGVDGREQRRPVECVSGGLGSWAQPAVVVTPLSAGNGTVDICDDGRLHQLDFADTASALDTSDADLTVDVAYDGSVAALLDATGRLAIIHLDGDSAVDDLQIDVPLPDEFSTGPGTYVSPNGATVVVTSVQPDPTGSTTGRLVATVWDADSGDQLGTIGPAAIDDLAFTADGDLVAVALSDGDIEIRDGRTLQLMTVLPGDGNGRIRVLEFSRDGTTLAEASTGGALVLWDLDVQRWARRACGIANRDLTREEVRVFYGELEPPTTLCDTATPEDADVPSPRIAFPDAATHTADRRSASRPTRPLNNTPQPAATSPADPADVCARFRPHGRSSEIRFDPGTSSGTVTANGRRDQARHYRLEARAGQRIDVAVDTPHLICVRDGSGLQASGVRRVISDLPRTGQYQITVVAREVSGRYTMTVTIP